jgi:hypothetical protein
MGDLPCGDDLFEAKTAVEFERAVTLGSPGLPVSTFPQLMSILLFAPVSEPPAQMEIHVSAASMLILVCGMLCPQGNESAAEYQQRYSPSL